MFDPIASLGWLGSFALLVVGFGFIIFVHELGHFLVAKFVGIKVMQFSMGFGPAALAWRKGIGCRVGSTEPEVKRRVEAYLNKSKAQRIEDREQTGVDKTHKVPTQDEALAALGLGETEYRLNYFPLGGYVKMLGQEDLDPNAVSDDARSYNRKSVGARAAVISAGVIMNLIFAAIFFIIAFMCGVKFPPAIVGEVVPDSPAALAFPTEYPNDKAHQGLRMDDKIIAIDGKAPTDQTDVLLASALGSPDHPIAITVQRSGEAKPLTYAITPKKDPDTGLLQMGIGPPISTKLVRPEKTPKDHDGWPKELTDARVEPGMRLTAVDGQPIEHYGQFDRALEDAKGLPVRATFVDDATKRTADVDLRAEALGDFSRQNKRSTLLGLIPATIVKDLSPSANPQEKTPAEQAGVHAGDQIAALDGVAWPSLERTPGIIRESAGRPLSITVWRDGKLADLSPVTLKRGQLLGIKLGMDSTRISGASDEAPGALRDLRLPPGSQITSANGHAVQTLSQLQRELQLALDRSPRPQTIRLGYALFLPGEPKGDVDVPVDNALADAMAQALWAPADLALDHGLGVPVFEPLREPITSTTPWAATVMGLRKTWQFMLQTYVTLGHLFSGEVPASQMQGMVGIATIGTRIAHDSDLSYLFFFLGLISVNLVVINFLPIPVVDGGHMLFLLIEKTRGKPVPIKIQTAATYAGLCLILGVFLMTLYFDVFRLIGG